MTTTGHPWGPSVLRVIAVSTDGAPMDCEDDETAHVWVKVPGWTPRRAFCTGASPFATTAQCDPEDLIGRVFTARIDLDAVPGNDDTAGERLEWPDLRLAPPIPDEWTSPR